MVQADEQAYIPALRFRFLTPLYDAVLRLTLREDRFKSLLVRQASPAAGQRVLDLGCGTGTLTLMLKRACPAAAVVGLDADPEVLALARRKMEEAGLDVALQRGFSTETPFPAASFDRVVSSLFFHHLDTTAKRRTLDEVRRLLRPGGELHVADWGPPHGPFMRLAFLGVQFLDGFRTTADNVRGLLPTYMADAGFADVTTTARVRTMLGSLALWRGHRA